MALNRCKNGHMYSARKYGDVCPYCNTNLETSNMVNNRRLMVDDPDKTMSINGTTESVNPVTGWLVCIEGPHYGKDYKIHAGKNFIGREIICIFRFWEIIPYHVLTMLLLFMTARTDQPTCFRVIPQD